MAAVTAVTAQNTRGVSGVEPISPAFIRCSPIMSYRETELTEMV